MTNIYIIPVIFILSCSIIGYGYIFKKLFFEDKIKIGFSVYGILGIIFLTFISYISNIFIAHNEFHNFLIHFIGVIFFIYLFKKKLNYKYILYILILIIVLLPALYIFKTHDDFPYYHLPYIKNLIENKILIGNGNFSLAHRTHSSIFYYGSLFYLPYFKFKFINFTYFSVLIFSNLFIIENLFNKKNISESKLTYYLYLFAFIFLNVIFYRISEYGTDRTGQIFIFFLLISFINILNNFENLEFNIKFLTLLTIFLITIKTYFITYSIFIIFSYIFLIIKKNENIYKIFINKFNFFLLFILFIYLIKNFLNNGCLIYPLPFTCFENYLWSQKLSSINYLSQWYELWSKAGANPNFRVDDPQLYLKNFNWVPNWFTTYFFNKVSDFLFGLILISLICFFSFYSRKKVSLSRNTFTVFLTLFIIFFVWFMKHPSLRYGGYSLIALIVFFPLSLFLEKFKLSFKKKKKITLIILIISLFFFEIRNFIRINKEISIYGYDIVSKPLQFIKEIPYQNISKNNIEIYNPKKGEMCWSIKSPCVYRSDLNVIKKYNYKIFFK